MNPVFFNGGAILTPINEAVVGINDDLLKRLPGDVLTSNADDTMKVVATKTLPLSVLRLMPQ